MTVFRPRPGPGVAAVEQYEVARARAPVDLALDGNEGMHPPQALLKTLADASPELLRRYPDAGALEARLAQVHGVEPASVYVTAGADEALDRLCRAFLGPGREIVLPSPTFVMIPRYAQLAQGTIVEVPWDTDEYPLRAVLDALTPRTALVTLVSPNNPTGGVASAAMLRELSAAAPEALIVVDQAYAEFAEEDLTPVALTLPNAVSLRTFSKVRGLAGLRVGYALGPPDVLALLRAAGGPYSVSSVSMAIATFSLDDDAGAANEFVARIGSERTELEGRLSALGARVRPSQANFVCAHFSDPLWLRDACAGLGIGVRAFPGERGLEGALRITCPGDSHALERLVHALETALSPEALLFDLDGVLADVSGSYRRTILETALTYGVTLTAAEVSAAKTGEGVNNDWELTRRLLSGHGVQASLGGVTERFEHIYQGTEESPGLRETESLIPPFELVRRLAERLPMAIVTGRPRADLERFLEHAGLTELVRVTVCMQDGPLKPDPAPVRLALERLGVRRAWMIGDTPDDIRAARRAGVIALGVLAPGEPDARGEFTAELYRAGAARVLDDIASIERILP